jgi:type I restriction enzyme S subunit
MYETSTVNLGDLVNSGHLEIGDGYRTKRSEHGKPGLPILRVAEVLDGRIAPEFTDFVSDRYRMAMGSKISRPGDVVLTTKGTVGRIAIMPAGGPQFVYSPQVCYFRAEDRSPLAINYLYYWFRSEAFWSQARSLKSQTDMADYINLADIKSLEIELPSDSVQASVTSVLAALDDKITINEEILRASRGLMMLKYENAIQAGVEETTIGAVAQVFDGPHATPKKTESGPWFLSISSLRNGRLVLEESAHLAEPDFEKWTRRVTPTAGDVLFSYETRLGEAALMPTGIRACLGRRMALMRPHGVEPRTLLQAFLSPSFQETIKQYSVHGATVDRIPLSEFPSWRIGLPTQEPQQLEYVLRHLDELAEQRERENETLAEIRDALLPKLMSGEIRVREAEKVVEEVT